MVNWWYLINVKYISQQQTFKDKYIWYFSIQLYYRYFAQRVLWNRRRNWLLLQWKNFLLSFITNFCWRNENRNYNSTKKKNTYKLDKGGRQFCTCHKKSSMMLACSFKVVFLESKKNRLDTSYQWYSLYSEMLNKLQNKPLWLPR